MYSPDLSRRDILLPIGLIVLSCGFSSCIFTNNSPPRDTTVRTDTADAVADTGTDTAGPDGGGCEPSNGGTEICDGKDNDCDGNIDENDADDATTWYADGDGDGFGDPDRTKTACDKPDGYVDEAGDCNPSNAEVHPDATEECNGRDDDCDGKPDNPAGQTCECEPGNTQPCGNSEGQCSKGTQTCGEDGTWEACSGNTEPQEEVCDGKDNDCDGESDENLTQQCPLQKGVCSGSSVKCTGGSFPACSNASGSQGYPDDYERKETTTDSLDNDCDGLKDNIPSTRSYPRAYGNPTSDENNRSIARSPVVLEGQPVFMISTSAGDPENIPVFKLVRASKTNLSLNRNYEDSSGYPFTFDATRPKNGVAKRPNNGVCATASRTDPNTGKRGMVLKCFNAQGNPEIDRWLESTQDADVAGQDVAVHSNGSIYVTGITFGTVAGKKTNGRGDIFVTKYNSQGDNQWTETFGGSSRDKAHGVAVNSKTGNIFVTGNTKSDLGNHTAEGRDAFLMKLNSGGKKQWVKHVSSSKEDRALSVAFDPKNDAVYISGDVSAAPTSNTNFAGGNGDGMLARYTTGGQRKWVEVFGTVAADRGFRVDTDDETGEVYLAGNTDADTSTFLGKQTPGWRNIAILNYKPNGSREWVKVDGTQNGGNAARGVVADDASHDVYVTGWTQDGLGCSGNNCGPQDPFVMRIKDPG